MKESSVRICRVVRASYVFVFYFFLGLLTSVISFAQDYVPIRDGRGTDSGFHGRMITKYGVSPRIRMRDLEPKEPKIDKTENKEKFGDSEKENEKVIDAYGVIVSEKDLMEDKRTFKEKQRRWNNDMVGAYGVALSEEPLEADKAEE